MSGPAAIEASDVRYAYPDGRLGLDGVDLHVGAGERVAVVGPNGAGKTTLALLLAGVLVPGAGRVEVGGIDTSDAKARRSGALPQRVGLLFQDPDDQLFLPTVRDDVAFGPRNLGLRDAELDQAVARALAAVDLEDRADRSPHHLSLGERRRAALAGVLAMDPGALVLDEPSANLDPAARRDLAERLLARSATLVVVTHDLPYALRLCERTCVLDGGRVVADGPTREVLGDAELLAAHRLELPWGFALEPEA